MKKILIIVCLLLLLTTSVFAGIKTYAQIKDGKVINIFDWNNIQNPSISGHLFIDVTEISKPKVNDNYDGINFITFISPNIPITKRIITAWEFRKRLTPAERQMLNNSNNAQIKAIVDDIKSMGDNINLDDIDFKANMDILATIGIITPAREIDILK